jgi:hypothetical protein
MPPLLAHPRDPFRVGPDFGLLLQFAGDLVKLRDTSVQTKVAGQTPEAGAPVALISTRWRFRHDRVNVPDEALAYRQLQRTYPRLRFYAVLAEFSPARLAKVLSHAISKEPHGSIDGVVHLNPVLIEKGLDENGRIQGLWKPLSG